MYNKNENTYDVRPGVKPRFFFVCFHKKITLVFVLSNE